MGTSTGGENAHRKSLRSTAAWVSIGERIMILRGNKVDPVCAEGSLAIARSQIAQGKQQLGSRRSFTGRSR